MMGDALDVIGGLITEDGRPWAEAAVDVQVQDMNAWLRDERPYHYATRSRGFSKSADAAALALGELVTDPLMRGFWLAADQEQGRLAVESIEGYVQRISRRVRGRARDHGQQGRDPCTAARSRSWRLMLPARGVVARRG